MRTALKPRILVLDGETRSALAVVRSLGSAGFQIAVAATEARPLASSSRYVDYSFRLPVPHRAPEFFFDELSRAVKEIKPSFLLPLTDVSLAIVLKRQSELPKQCVVPSVSHETFAEVSNKYHLLNTAKSLGIEIPRTVLIKAMQRDPAELAALLQEMSFPAVVKPCASASPRGNGFEKPPIAFTESLEQVIAFLLANSEHDYLVQERIEGTGLGVFALARAGVPSSVFAHQRLLEKPPEGGVSVLSQSIPLSSAPLEETLKLLKHYNWDGVLMVEFKKTKDNRSVLMEINPRFWGSLQLAVDCGRNFPLRLVELHTPGPAAMANYLDEPAYIVGRRLRWQLGTLDHALIALRRKGLAALSAIFFKNSLLLFSSKDTKSEMWRRDDPRPFFDELLRYCRTLCKRRQN